MCRSTKYGEERHGSQRAWLNIPPHLKVLVNLMAGSYELEKELGINDEQEGQAKIGAVENYTLLLLQQACTTDHLKAYSNLRNLTTHQAGVLQVRLAKGDLLDKLTFEGTPLRELV